MISSLHRPTVAKIDLEAIAANIEAVKDRIPSDKKVYAVVKANAYGHGAVKVAQFVKDLVTGFCVSNVDEALELRQEGITKEILILGVVMPEELDLVIANDLTIAVASLAWVEAALKEELLFQKLHVHIKVDSGMGRIGFRKLEDANRAMALLREAGVHIDGIFTHFATADEADNSKFERQLAFFKDFLAGLESRPSLVHASNSATSLWHSETIFNAVRLGIVCYGLNPSGRELELPYVLKPALQLESALVHVKELEPGQDVGYGATYTSQGTEVIGTLPIGYADGWTRDMQNFSVLVDGQACPIVGRVSMDQITIRLPKPYPLGTPVVLIGNSGAETISATDIAHYRGTINYEVLCLLSDRIPRQYEQ
ncbi:alanine racemase [Streptococcus saliviloxodontae]|uniref:Alanine racemase n=1 Tax=Streptococcus saliviloxodontae TaxID=1349416 RepID=A0ABS2PIU7_9STRE|nr:alanine racemase [Streptococcus saliviloxodontae]MBM7635355.1 alanine racemase [Streptococcus saliviloxodontae]